jgi:gliding motility-associated-like protein
MKHFYPIFSFIFLLLIAPAAFSQGTTCANALQLYPAADCNNSSGQQYTGHYQCETATCGHMDLTGSSGGLDPACTPDNETTQFVRWIKFTATANNITITNKTSYTGPNAASINKKDFVLYSGTCGNLTQLGCAVNLAKDAAQTFTGLVVGQTYYIMVSRSQESINTGSTANGAATCLTSTVPYTPPHNNCNNATSLTTNVTISSTNASATADGPAAVCLNPNTGSIENNVWYSWCAPANWPAGQTAFLNLTNSVCNAANGIQIGVYAQPCNGLTTSIACYNPQSTANIFYQWVATANTCYLFNVDGFAGTACSYNIMVGTVVANCSNPLFSYPNSTYCLNGTNPTPVFNTGSVAGTFSATPFGLSINSSTGVINLAASNAGTYTVTNALAASGSCPAQSATFTITVSGLPVATFSYANNPYCANATNASPTFSGGGTAGTFTEPSGNLSLNAATGQINFSASQPGTYTVTNTIAATTACPSASSTATVTINPVADPYFSYSSGTFCQNGTATPNTITTPGGTFTASPNTLVINSSTGEVDLVLSPAGTYTITYSLGGSCPSSTTRSITITSAPDAGFSYASPFCANDNNPVPSFNTNASAGTFSANPSGLVFTNNPGEIDLLYSVPGTYTITNSINEPGCALSTANFQVTIFALPSIPVASYNSIVCEGGTINLTATSDPGATFTWSGPVVFAASMQSPSISNADLTLSGEYTVIATLNGCSSSSSIQVDVEPNPSIGITPSPAQVCVGVPLSIIGSANTNASFDWTGSIANLSSTNTGATTFSANTSGTYNFLLTATDIATGCIANQSLVVTVLPEDDAFFQFSSPVYCNSGTAVPNTNTPGGIFSASPAGLTINPASGVVDLATSAFGSYAISYTTNGQCPQSHNTSLNISIPPAPSVNTPTAYCQGQTVAPITATGLGGTFLWYSDATLTNLIFSGNPLTPNISTTMTFYVTELVMGCTSPATAITVTINPTPATPVANSSSPLCQGQPLVLTCSSNAGTYNWNGPNGFISNAQNPNLGATTVNQTGVYSVTVTQNGCTSAPANVTVVVNPNPAKPVATNNGPICPGNPIELSATSTAGAVFNWTGPNGFTSNAQNPLINDVSNDKFGIYSVRATLNGCSSAASSTTVSPDNIQASFVPSVTSGIVPLPVDFQNTSTAASSFVWNFGNGETSATKHPSTTFQDGTYNVILIAYNATKTCTDTFTVAIVVDGVSSFKVPNVFSPNGDNKNDVFKIEGKNLITVKAEIYSRWGQKIYEWNTQDGSWDGKMPSGENAADGTYFYLISATGADKKEYKQQGHFTLIR